MKDPGLFSEPRLWQGQSHVSNVLGHVRDGYAVGLIEPLTIAQGGALELFAVIVPIEQYRQMVRVEPAEVES